MLLKINLADFWKLFYSFEILIETESKVNDIFETFKSHDDENSLDLFFATKFWSAERTSC